MNRDMRPMVAKAIIVPARVRATILAVGVLALAACGGDGGAPAPVAPAEVADFIGTAACTGCHADEAALWQGSQHDRAMQVASAATVLGDFDDAEFAYGESVTRFTRRGDAFTVTTDGPDGVPTEYVVRWTFGVDPLQQYLVETERGHVQALSVAWDSRPAAAGGQRWFHLYPGETIDFRDPLHWTGAYQRWNTMCADCHSTHVQKGYDVAGDSFDTRWAAIDVGCEGCHGPGSLHAANPADFPLTLGAVPHDWTFTAGNPIAVRSGAAAAASEVDVCAQCHARRTQLTDAHLPGEPFLDAYQPALLDPGLYHADGQIEGEVYVYGSFAQSAMAAAGVTCSDCHEPHTAALRADGNAVCARCHLPGVFDQPSHHHHEAGSDAARCTSCHMRAETYMIVDPRRDHSFRVPRPDLSAATQSPNACNDCHADETSDWAAGRVAEWFPGGRQTQGHYGEALAAGRLWTTDARERLIALIEDAGRPAIARASAIGLLTQRLAPGDVDLLRRHLESDEPLVQLAVIEGLADLDPAIRVDLVQRFLNDDLRALRIAAGRTLLTARESLSERRQGDLDAAIAEYLAAQDFNSDRPEGRLNAAGVAGDEGRLEDAESILLEAIDRFPAYTALYVNLADLYRVSGRADESEGVLRAGLAVSPDDASLRLALGFALVRVGRPADALEHFIAAAARASDQPYYRYVLGIAYNDVGQADRALAVLTAANARFPGYPDVIYALATMYRDRGDIEAAYGYAEQLNGLLPGAPEGQSLLSELGQQL
jgi:predicted CXXCH cytochrome family protein